MFVTLMSKSLEIFQATFYRKVETVIITREFIPQIKLNPLHAKWGVLQ